MKEYYDIAVVGESMAGKSTWIASLFREDIAGKLQKLSKENREGQTKISVYYRLHNPEGNDFQVVGIGWKLEALAKVLKGDKYPQAFRKLMISLKMPYQDATEMEEDMLQSGLADYFQTEEYISCIHTQEPFSFLRDVVNNEEIRELGTIAYVETDGAASDEAWAEISRYGVEWIRMRDTRGFLAETESEMLKYLEWAKCPSTYSGKLLDDRGIYDVDACVLMGMAGTNTLSKKLLKSIYGPPLRNILEKYPVFLVIRSDRLIDICQNASELNYDAVIEKNEAGTFRCLGKPFMGSCDLHKLLQECGLRKNSGVPQTDLAQEYYSELIFADIPTEGIPEEERRKYAAICRMTVIGAFSEMLRSMRSYERVLNKAEVILNSLSKDRRAKMERQIFDEIFDGRIDLITILPDKRHEFASYCFKRRSKGLAEKVHGAYYGGLVGMQGGLTTGKKGGGLVGDAAIDFLETAYRIRDHIYHKLAEKLTEEITIKSNQSAAENEKDFIETKLIKNYLTLYFEQEVEEDFQWLSRTDKKIPRERLRSAYEKTRQELDINENRSDTYCAEFESPPAGGEWSEQMKKQWLDDRHGISVVKRMLYHILYD